MVEIETLIILTINAIIAVSACIPLGFAFKKQKNLRYLYITYLVMAAETVLSLFQFGNLLITLIVYLLVLLTVVSFCISTFLEYYRIFIKSNSKRLSVQDKLMVTSTISLFTIIIGVEIFCIIILLLSAIMLFRIYLKTHSPTTIFLFLIAISAIITVIALCVSEFGVEGAYFVENIMTTFFVTLMFSTGFVALLEQKVIETLKEKNDIKDRFSHDLGNILHNITMAYDTINMENISQMKKDDLNILIKDKINDASKLVRVIRDI